MVVGDRLPPSFVPRLNRARMSTFFGIGDSAVTANQATLSAARLDAVKSRHALDLSQVPVACSKARLGTLNAMAMRSAEPGSEYAEFMTSDADLVAAEKKALDGLNESTSAAQRAFEAAQARVSAASAGVMSAEKRRKLLNASAVVVGGGVLLYVLASKYPAQAQQLTAPVRRLVG
jgi:hypothetical protein